MIHPRTPVLIGAGQAMSPWDGSGAPAGAPSPLSLMLAATRAALADTGIARADAAIDTLAVVRIFEDSVPGDRHPHGHNTNLPGTLARDARLSPQRLIYETVGGQSPQALVNEMAARIHAGEIDGALIAGSEANRASKGARKHGAAIDWADGADARVDDRGLGPMLLSRAEIKHGLVTPAYFYGLFENALAAKHDHSRAQHRRAMADLFAPFSAVAAANPFAQFPDVRSAAFLSTPSRENYEYADPYLKWFMAQDAVNQGAAVIMVSEAKADALGIAPENRIYLHGAGEAGDDHLTERPRLDRSWAMDVAVARALEQAGVAPENLKHLDIYSCFPIAVFSACAALGLDWQTDPRALTLTGGLPFFGGPGNNYALHGIAEMLTRLRRHRADKGLVLANGGWMSKEAVGIYAAEPPQSFTPVGVSAKPAQRVTLCTDDCSGVLETFTVTHDKDGPAHAVALVRLADARRALAVATGGARDVLREQASPVGRKVQVNVSGETGTLSFT
jgi:acetyl-CoA C-acetyltransferase